MAQNCPECANPMTNGFIHAGEDCVRWSAMRPAEILDGGDIPLQPTANTRTFRLSASLSPPPLAAFRCEGCRIVIFQYECEYPWR